MGKLDQERKTALEKFFRKREKKPSPTSLWRNKSSSESTEG